MRAAVLLLGFSSMVSAGMAQQQVWVYGPSNTPAPVPVPGAATQGTRPTQPAKTYHEIASNSTALELVELTGARKHFEADRVKAMEQAKQEIQRDYPNLNPAFVNEWATQFSARTTAETTIAIAARVYAAHFTDDELTALVQGQKNMNAGRRSGLAPPLRDKLERELPTMAGEIAGALAQTGAKVSTEVAEKVAREHPDWIKRAAASSPSR